ncbi:hypothetical protein F4806DRAFT_507047, partial [Annulohypoxylon nitens]
RILPIAFVFPPATLSVKVVPITTSALQHVPNFDITSLRYVAGMPPTTLSDDYSMNYLYNGPSIEIQKIATAVAAGEAILPMNPPTANSSWSLDFYGPSINCNSMEERVQSQVMNNIMNWLWNETNINSLGNCLTPYEYLAWTSNFDASISNESNPTPIPFINSKTGDWTVFSTGSPLSPLSPIYIAVMPEIIKIRHNGPNYYIGACELPKFTEENDKNFWQCNLHNASYRAIFKFETGTQSIDLSIDQLEAVETIHGVHSSFSQDKNCVELTKIGAYDTDGVSSPMCLFDTSLLRKLSYTAIFDAFRQIIIGSVSINSTFQPVTDTNVISSTLINTPELSFLQERINGGVRSLSLQTTINNLTGVSRVDWLASPQIVVFNKSLQSTLEEMFHNITISLLSSEVLQPSITSEFAPPKVNVTKTMYEPIYDYSAVQLWISYGIAIFISLFASICGVIALRSNGASYSSDFSTIYRVAFSVVLNTTMRLDDTDGADPLPKYLGDANFQLGENITGSKDRATSA